MNLLALQRYRGNQGCGVTSSGCFEHKEPHRTFSTHLRTGLARCVAFCLMRSGWFGRTEPSLSTFSQGKQGREGAQALGRGFSSKPPESKVCSFLSQQVGVVRPHRSSSYIVTGETRCARSFCLRLGWFTHVEPPRTFSKHRLTECGKWCACTPGR